jgi:SAM-dependent methyltransferase
MSKQGSDYSVISGCRTCGNPDLKVVLPFGDMPLSDGLMPSDADRTIETVYPLTFVWCHQCSLAQILETVDPTTLFGEEYPYYSSFSPALVEHSRNNVEGLIDRTGVDESSLVVELASNDGYLLQWFAKEGIPVLGIDPAPGPAEAAEARGIPTICDFFTVELAQKLVSEGRRADIIVGNNVLAHVPDQNAFVAAIEMLLSPDGTVVMEFPYLRDLVDKCEFDTIYHEHHCYFSVHAVSELFRRHGLTLVRVEHLSIHGGSLRVYFQRGSDVEESVGRFLDEEKSAGVLEAAYYSDFAVRATAIRDGLTQLLGQLKTQDARIAGYGAAAKGAILLNFCGIDDQLLDYVVDRNHHKHGWEMPGMSLPIHAPDHLQEETPDYLLILAWNFKDEIMGQQDWFAKQGGRFIVPIPEPKIL